MKKTILFMMVSKRLKYIEKISQNKYKIYTLENYKTLLKEIQALINGKTSHNSWIERFSIIKMTIFPK